LAVLADVLARAHLVDLLEVRVVGVGVLQVEVLVAVDLVARALAAVSAVPALPARGGLGLNTRHRRQRQDCRRDELPHGYSPLLGCSRLHVSRLVFSRPPLAQSSSSLSCFGEVASCDRENRDGSLFFAPAAVRCSRRPARSLT